MRFPHPIRAWKEAGEFDAKILRDYEPGPLAPLDMPIGLQGAMIFVGGMGFISAAALGFFIYEIFFA